jgi:hypothetical protein
MVPDRGARRKIFHVGSSADLHTWTTPDAERASIRQTNALGRVSLENHHELEFFSRRPTFGVFFVTSV